MAREWVAGYTRSDGTVVAGHWRTVYRGKAEGADGLDDAVIGVAGADATVLELGAMSEEVSKGKVSYHGELVDSMEQGTGLYDRAMEDLGRQRTAILQSMGSARVAPARRRGIFRRGRASFVFADAQARLQDVDRKKAALLHEYEGLRKAVWGQMLKLDTKHNGDLRQRHYEGVAARNATDAGVPVDPELRTPEQQRLVEVATERVARRDMEDMLAGAPTPWSDHHRFNNIGFDLDGCYYDFLKSLRNSARGHGKVLPEDSPKTYAMVEPGWFNDSSEFKEIYRKMFDTEEFRKMELLDENAAAVSRRIRKHGKKVTIRTARVFPGTDNEDTYRQTRDSLAKHGIEFDELHVTPDKKGADIMWDDAPYNIEALRSAGVPAVVRDHPYNEDTAGDARAANALEYEDIVMGRRPLK